MLYKSSRIGYSVFLGVIDKKAMPTQLVVVVAVDELKLAVVIDADDDEIH